MWSMGTCPWGLRGHKARPHPAVRAWHGAQPAAVHCEPHCAAMQGRGPAQQSRAQLSPPPDTTGLHRAQSSPVLRLEVALHKALPTGTTLLHTALQGHRTKGVSPTPAWPSWSLPPPGTVVGSPRAAWHGDPHPVPLCSVSSPVEWVHLGQRYPTHPSTAMGNTGRCCWRRTRLVWGQEFFGVVVNKTEDIWKGGCFSRCHLLALGPAEPDTSSQSAGGQGPSAVSARSRGRELNALGARAPCRTPNLPTSNMGSSSWSAPSRSNPQPSARRSVPPGHSPDGGGIRRFHGAGAARLDGVLPGLPRLSGEGPACSAPPPGSPTWWAARGPGAGEALPRSSCMRSSSHSRNSRASC